MYVYICIYMKIHTQTHTDMITTITISKWRGHEFEGDVQYGKFWKERKEGRNIVIILYSQNKKKLKWSHNKKYPGYFTPKLSATK